MFCPTCQAEFESRHCPNCGPQGKVRPSRGRRRAARAHDDDEDESPRRRVRYEPRKSSGTAFGIIVSIGIAVALFVMCGRGKESDSEKVLYVARDAVRKQLIAPADAEFPSMGVVNSAGPNKWIVRGDVDAKNRLGVRVRHRWEVTVEKAPGGWRWNVDVLE